MKETVQKLDSSEAVAIDLTEATQQETLHDNPRSLESHSESTEPPNHGPVRGASGSRSHTGKTRSSRNSLKHGIFSYATVLQGEHPKQYASLLEALRKDLKPQGGLQELLVEKLAMTTWRYRRLILAESAEIEKKAALERFDRWARKQEEAEGLSRPARFGDVGLVTEIRSPLALQYCLDLLADLRKRIDREGFNEEKDLALLAEMYAYEGWGDRPPNLQDIYLQAFTEATRNQAGNPSAEESKQAFLAEIDREMHKLRRDAKRTRLQNPDQTKAEALEHVILLSPPVLDDVPTSPPVLDNLIRYETALERHFERALAQLMRLQEKRSGQPVLPPVPVKGVLEP
jgi:hypothetical protein